MAGGPDPTEVLPLTVLPYMRQPLIDWLGEVCQGGYSGPDYWELLTQMLQLDYTGMRPQATVITAVNADNDTLLDLVDARLRLGNAYQHHDALRRILFLAGSGWRLNDDADGLEHVVDESVKEAALQAIAAAEASASQHLKNAWAETYGKTKNPTHAHSEMVRAVESAARPVVTPKDKLATLGTLIGQMEQQGGSLYTTAGASSSNDGVAGVVGMMKTLWQQQTDRHGANPTVPATQERVEFLLPIAAALVHAFSTGAIRRV